MITRRTTTISLALLCCLALAGQAAAAGTPEQKCAASKLKAAAKKFSADAKCHTSALGAGADVEAECLSKAAAKYGAAFTKAEEAGGCMIEGDAAGIDAKLEAAVEDVVSDLACGNGRVDGGEACDDDGFLSGDGCDSTCAIETGFACSGEPSVCAAVCGDGLIAGAETCDDSDLDPGDGCSASCAVEAGFTCSGEPSVCSPICLMSAASCMLDSECCSNVCFLFHCL